MAALKQFNLATHLPATFTAPGLNETQFLALCEKFPDCALEYSADGTVLIMPPTDPENSARVAETVRQLGDWTVQDGRGVFIGPDGGFFLPDGSRRSPDAAWFEIARWKAVKRPGTRFPTFAPDFLIEIRSPGQRAAGLREKMQEYMANGVRLAWLLDPIEHTVAIYRPGQEPEVLVNPATVAGEGPIQGFVLALDRILY